MRPADVIVLMEMRAACASGAARRARIAVRVTQAELADACHVSPRTVAAWETGQRTAAGKPALVYAGLVAKMLSAGGHPRHR